MHPKNREKFDFAGILAWHEAGYTGRGVTVATLERETSEHGQMTADIIRQVAPGANVVFRKVPSIRAQYGKLTPDSAKGIEEFYHSLAAEGVHIVTMSKDGTSAENIADLEKGILHAGGVTMVTSAGNEGREIRATEAAALDTWIAVGAANIINGQLKRVRYSNTGAALDVMGFSELYTVAGVPFDGTSASAPFVAGMLALWFERFYEVNGRYPTHQESYEFCVANTVDMEDKGFDEKTGYGLFVLPKPESIKGDKVMPAKRPLIYIDPGHGGVDNGAIDNGIIEKNLNLQVACQVRDLLRAHGVDVKMAREDDLGVASNEELWFRTSEANALNASAYVSIHHNWIDLPNVHGIEVYHSIFEGPGGDLARKISAELVEALPMADRGVRQRASTDGKRDYYHVIRATEMPAVITECGYLSSQKDVEIMKHPDFVPVQATAIARGILWWLGLEPTVKLVLSMTTEEVVGVSKFKDVPAGHWAESAVKKAADEGIISGFGDDTFRGDEPLTRYQMAAVIANLLDWVKKGGK